MKVRLGWLGDPLLHLLLFAGLLLGSVFWNGSGSADDPNSIVMVSGPLRPQADQAPARPPADS